jgi:hypothetical protein
MDRSAAKAIVDAHLDELQALLGIQHWRVRVSYDPLESERPGWDTLGNCFANPDYDSSLINLNADALDNEEQVLSVLRHELFHVVLSPYNVVENLLAPVLEGDATKRGMFASIWTHAMEQTVINLERMFVALTKAKASADG